MASSSQNTITAQQLGGDLTSVSSGSATLTLDEQNLREHIERFNEGGYMDNLSGVGDDSEKVLARVKRLSKKAGSAGELSDSDDDEEDDDDDEWVPMPEETQRGGATAEPFDEPMEIDTPTEVPIAHRMELTGFTAERGSGWVLNAGNNWELGGVTTRQKKFAGKDLFKSDDEVYQRCE